MQSRPREEGNVVHMSAGFNDMYLAINRSRVYREAVRASAKGLPDWLVPFSTIDVVLLERIAAELGVKDGETIVDLGCGAGGPGLWVAEHTGASLIGLDFAAAAVDAAASLAERRNMTSRAQFVVADATATGLPSGSISGVMSVDALMFIDPQRVAKEIGRILRPDGVVVATAAESLVEPFMPTLVRNYRLIFEAAGFRIRHHEKSTSSDEQRLALYRALQERCVALRAEIGEAANVLLEEARDGLERDTKAIRVRHVLLIAERLHRS